MLFVKKPFWINILKLINHWCNPKPSKMMTFWVRWINLDTSRWHSLSSEMKHVFHLRPNTYKHFLKWHVLLINTTHENNATKENMSQLTFLLFYLRRLSKTCRALCFISISLSLLLCAFICFLVFGNYDEALTLVFDIIITYFH